MNDRIRATEVRVVDPKGNHGIYPTEVAMQMADDQDLDLVEISPC